MWWRAKRCPVEAQEHDWIIESMRWLGERFGPEPLRRPVILPTPEYFPGTYSGTEADVRSVFERVAGYMRIDPSSIDLDLVVDDEHALLEHLPIQRERHGAAGTFEPGSGRPLIHLDLGQAEKPTALVATIAHELGHTQLHGTEREDLEPLTDLLAIYFGLGIFGANAAFEYDRGGWSRLGYLTEPMFGYTLAHYALLRGEDRPTWAKHVDTNPRTFLHKGLRYLAEPHSSAAAT